MTKISHISKKADKAMQEILNKSDKMSKHGTSAVDVSEDVKVAVKALYQERQVSEEQLNRRITI